jgi:uncharacterized protein (UPF0332 family)
MCVIIKWSIFVSKEEIQLYLDRARQDLQAVEINIQNDLYNVAISRAYYAMFYAATALLKSKGIERNNDTDYDVRFVAGAELAKSRLQDAQKFVEQVETHLRKGG